MRLKVYELWVYDQWLHPLPLSIFWTISSPRWLHCWSLVLQIYRDGILHRTPGLGKKNKDKHWNCIVTKIISLLLNWAMSEQHGCWITHALGLMWLIVGTSSEAYRSWNTLSLIMYVTASLRQRCSILKQRRNNIFVFGVFLLFCFVFVCLLFCGWGGQVPSQSMDLST